MESNEAVADLWLRRVLRDFPEQTEHFLATERDPFRNPAGHTLRHALGILLDELLLESDAARATAGLDSLMQLRAVQDGPPSSALRFLFQLKDILRVHCQDADLSLLSSRIDQMALQAFDLFMKYRERICQARANEARRRVFTLEKRMNADDLTHWQNRGGH